SSDLMHGAPLLNLANLLELHRQHVDVLDARRLRQQLVCTTKERSRDGAVQMRRAPRLTREHVEDPEGSLTEPDGKPRDCLRLVVYWRQSTLEDCASSSSRPACASSRTSS